MLTYALLSLGLLLWNGGVVWAIGRLPDSWQPEWDGIVLPAPGLVDYVVHQPPGQIT